MQDNQSFLKKINIKFYQSYKLNKLVIDYKLRNWKLVI